MCNNNPFFPFSCFLISPPPPPADPWHWALAGSWHCRLFGTSQWPPVCFVAEPPLGARDGSFRTRLVLSLHHLKLNLCIIFLSRLSLSLSVWLFFSSFLWSLWYQILFPVFLSHEMRFSTLILSYTLIFLSLRRSFFNTYWASENTTGCSIDVSFCAISSRRFIMARLRSPAVGFDSPVASIKVSPFSPLLSAPCHFHPLYCICLHSPVRWQMRAIVHSPLSILMAFILRLLYLARVRCIQKIRSTYVNVMMSFFITSSAGLFVISYT